MLWLIRCYLNRTINFGGVAICVLQDTNVAQHICGTPLMEQCPIARKFQYLVYSVADFNHLNKFGLAI